MIPMIICEYFKMLSSIYPIVKKLQKLLMNTYDNHLDKIMKKQLLLKPWPSLLVKQLNGFPYQKFNLNKGFYTRSYILGVIEVRSKFKVDDFADI